MDKTLIERAIDSAKHRQYKLSADLKRDISDGHRKKAEKQKEVAEVTVMALERMIPKKPDIQTGLMECYIVCPECGSRIALIKWREEIADMVKCCRECGQRLDWSEEHEEIE